MQCLGVRSAMHSAFSQQMGRYRQGPSLTMLHELGEVEHGVSQLGRVRRCQRLLQRVRELSPRCAV